LTINVEQCINYDVNVLIRNELDGKKSQAGVKMRRLDDLIKSDFRYFTSF